MPDWRGPRYDAGWVYRRVAWDTWMEVGEYSNIESLSYSKSALNSLKLSGSASCDGEPPDEIDAVTAYYTFTDGSGEVALVPVMTFLVESDEPQYSASDDGIARSSSLKFYSLLKVLSDIVPEGSLTIPAGTNAVAKAKDIAESVGLRTNNPSSTYTTNEDKTFGSDSTYLSIVNWLLDVAGYASARTDARGVVQMEPYVEPTDRPVSWTFRNDDDSTLLSGPSCENDWRSTPNVVTLEYQTESEYIIATARNIDPDSRASLPSRGWRTKSTTVSVSELDGETPQERLENLKALAVSEVKSESAEVQYVKIESVFVPVSVNDSIAIEYSGKTWRGNITAIDGNDGPSGDMTIKARIFIRRDILVDVDGKIF